MKQIWKTISTKRIFKGKWLSVMHDIVLLPNGKKGDYAYISKKNAVLIIVQHKDYFYMVKQYRYPVRKSLIEFPQGVSNKKELPIQAAVREAKEELGLNVTNLNLLGKIFLSKGSSNQKMYIYHVNMFKKTKQNLDQTETDLVILKLSRRKLELMIQNGKITDGPTLAAYCLLQLKIA